jgi:hypothetical protein
VQRTGNGGNVEGITSGTRGGETTSPWCALCASLSGEKEKGRDGVRSARRHASDTPARRETREGGSGTGTRARIESRQACRGKRGVQCKGRGECGAMPRPRERGTHGSHHRRCP